MQEQKSINANWNLLYKLGSIAAIGAVLVGIVEIAITFFPGGNASQESVYEWFLFFQQSPFLGLRNLGLLNIFLNTLAIFTYLALYGVHRQTPYQPLAALAVIFSFLGIGVFFATNRAFAMLAADEAQRAALIAAGQAMLSVGASHSPGTFLAFFLSESAGVLISVVMLRSNVFGRLAAYAGILGFSILLLFEFITSFFSGLVTATMILSMLGGLMSMVWYILIARRLFQLSTE